MTFNNSDSQNTTPRISTTPSASTITGRTGRNIRISHRRTPSELTPLMQENLALQQQNEFLQAQQQMLLQRHFSAGGHPVQMMYPPGPFVGGSPMAMHSGEMPYGSVNHLYVPVESMGMPNAGGHMRTHSGSSSFSPGKFGHNRRHSLAVSEARKSAHEEQQRRADNTKGSSGSSASHSASKSVAEPPRSSDFRFPPSPDNGGRSPRPLASTQSSQGRNSPSPQRRQFNFPAANQRYVPTNRQSLNAGSGHQHRRSNSRNFDGNTHNYRYSTSHIQDVQQQDYLQPSPQQQPGNGGGFRPGHRSRGSFGSTSSISAFMDNTGPNQGGNARKSLFVPYLTHSVIPDLVEQGLLVLGVLRVNRKNRSDAYVSTDSLDADIFICGSKDRNRALEGDLVAVELLDVGDVWDSKKEKEERKRRRDAQDENHQNNSGAGNGGELRRRGSLKQRPVQKRNDDVEVEGQALVLREEEAHSDEVRPLYAGHVVAIVERPSHQLFSGHLGLLRPSSQATLEKQEAERAERGEPPLNDHRQDRPKIVWFRPTDKCVPLMAIPTEQAPKDFVENHQAYANTIFVASVKRWPITSLHPFGVLVESIGISSEMEVKIDAILRDNNFGAQDNARMTEFLKATPELITNFESASPAVGLQFSDGITEQAIEIVDLENGNIRLVIYTIDVASMIELGSALDIELKQRSIGLSSKQRSVPLFPDEFGQKVSYSPTVSTPSIAVEFELDANTYDVVESPKIHKRRMCPTEVIAISDLETKNPKFYAKFSQIANAFKAQRGAYSCWLDNAINIRPIPTDNIFTPNEQVMLLMEVLHKANAAVAQRLLAEFGSSTLVLRQAEPLIAKLEHLGAILRSAGINLDLSSNEGIMKSLAKIENKDDLQVVLLHLYKVLPAPRYAVSGTLSPSQLSYFWINHSAYSPHNFPLRSYADLVTQRQISQMLCGDRSDYSSSDTQLASLATELSFRNDCLRTVVEQFRHLEVCQEVQAVANADNCVFRIGIVTAVHESAFDVWIPEFDLEKRVHGDQLPLVRAEYSAADNHLKLFWDSSKENKLQSFAVKKTDLAETVCNFDKECSEAMSKLTLSESDCVQTVRILDRIPIVLKVEFGARVLPSVVVKSLNPFYKQ